MQSGPPQCRTAASDLLSSNLFPLLFFFWKACLAGFIRFYTAVAGLIPPRELVCAGSVCWSDPLSISFSQKATRTAATAMAATPRAILPSPPHSTTGDSTLDDLYDRCVYAPVLTPNDSFSQVKMPGDEVDSGNTPQPVVS